MGNSNGTLAEYWDAIESTPGLQGGFIWEWFDHGLVQTLPDGRTHWALRRRLRRDAARRQLRVRRDGLAGPTARSPRCGSTSGWRRRSGSRARPRTSPRGGSRSRTTSTSRDLGWLRARYALTVDGDAVAGGAFELPALGPGERAIVALPGWTATRRRRRRGVPDGPRDHRRRTCPGRRPGFEVCALQLPVGEGRAAPRTAEPATDGAAVALDDEGRLVHPLLAAPPTLSLWRAPTDNDRIGGMAARWHERRRRPARAPPRSASSATAPRPSSAAIYTTAAGIEIPHEATYTALADGAIAVAESVDLPGDPDDLARVGTVLEVAAGPEALRWFGTGPHETYPDRKRGGLGRHVDLDRHRPVRPVHPAAGERRPRRRPLARADRAPTATGLRIDLDQPRQVSVTHVRAADLAAATHDIDLVPVPETIVHLDAAHRGLGTASCGPDTLPEYRLGTGAYRWAWTLRDLPRS